MEWLLVNPHLHNIFASLGSQIGDQYVVHPNCHATLDHIMAKLWQEDRTLRTFRRAIGFSNLIKKDLLLLLIAVKNDRRIIDKTIKLFAELTTPVENLLPVDVMSKTDAGRTTVIELNWLLFSAKESFLEPMATKRILDHVRILLDDGIEGNSCNEDTLTDCISLIRNILHVPESRPTSKANSTTYQSRLIWNLFSQHFDKVLINLASPAHRGKWKMGVVQLIVLLYKDQQDVSLQKLLHHWSETTVLSESSEDNESNTSPPDHYSRTSEPTSDSSDYSISEANGEQKQNKINSTTVGKKTPGIARKPFHRNQPFKKNDGYDRDVGLLKVQPGNNSKTADSGNDTLEENQEAFSTSSNDESPERKAKPVHQKPGNMIHKQRQPAKQVLTPNEKRERKMKKLQRRALNNSSLSGSAICAMNMVGHHNPSTEDISHILKEFTVDFLLSAYSYLVEDSRRIIVESRENVDSSQFFWLITYFLKFAVQLELDFDVIRSVLSKDVVTYLVYQGVFLCEQFENCRFHSDFDMTSIICKQHLLVTAIREILSAMNAHLKAPYVTQESKQLVYRLQLDLYEMQDLRNLFVLLLRQYNSDTHYRPYAVDLVYTNHILLDTIDKCPTKESTSLLMNHLKQFTATDIMRQYGNILECYQENGPIINDCIFTLMHHVSGPLNSLSSLFQPSIIRAFTLIYENGVQLEDDWKDLIEYVIHQFIASTKSIKTLAEPETSERQSPVLGREWSKEDGDALFWYFVQSANSKDPIGSIILLYSESGVQSKTRIGLIEQLLKQDIISDTQFKELMAQEPIASVESEVNNVNVKEGVDHLKDQLLSEGMDSLIVWVQKELLKACHAQLSLTHGVEGIAEATPLHYAMRGESVPLVPWNCEQCSAMQSHEFLLFLHKLGFLLPADTGHSFARIPKTWSSKTMFNLATKLGALPEEWINFDVGRIEMNT